MQRSLWTFEPGPSRGQGFVYDIVATVDPPGKSPSFVAEGCFSGRCIRDECGFML